MKNEEFLELLRLAQRQYVLALQGKRPVFCLACRRPFRARAANGRVFPFCHAAEGTREVCPGSEQLASLTS